MLDTFLIQTRAVGRKQALLPDWSIPIPTDWQKDGGRTTLRELITHVVLEEVEMFRDRQADRRFTRVLTRRQVEEGAQAGKVDPAERDLKQEVEPEAAVAAALTAFTDGLYYVFIDAVQHEDLDQTLTIAPDSQVTFLRLVALSGG